MAEPGDDAGADPEAGSEPRLDAGTRCATPPSTEVTLASLLREMSDLDHLTHAPSPAYTSSLASSFDRASLDAGPNDPAWFANHDAIALTAGTPTVLFDGAGPGTLTRLWSANPSGTLRVYIDGAAEPAIAEDMKALLRGDVDPFTSPYAFVAAGGYNFYFPIPFQKHCRVTVTSSAASLYFQINHRRYQDGSTVESFSKTALAGAACDRMSTEARLLDPATIIPVPSERAAFVLATAPGGATEHTMTAADGGVLRELSVKVADETASTALRETILRIEVDGEETVRTPFGDFFGTGPGWHELGSLPSDVSTTNRTLVARWPMPFRHDLKISLEPTSTSTLTADFTVHSEARTFSADTRLFYARWHPPDLQTSQPKHDWNLATLTGDGVYVGNMLNIWNSNSSWWGEGDEKIYVDGETFPSDFGTGTEDYYGYGWCSNQLFTTAFIGQTQAGTYRNYGATSLYRFHLLDAIEFSSELRFDFEVIHWGTTPVGVEYDSVVYFYGQPGMVMSPDAQSPQQFRVPPPTGPMPTNVSPGPYACGAG